MSFTAVGSFITTDQKTFTWAPASVGEVFALIAISTASVSPVTAVASSNATWVQCGTTQTLNGQGFTAWKGTATSASSGTVTLTSASANGNLRNFGHAASASGGGANVAFDALFTMDASVTGATTSWPAATPGHGTGELLFGAEFNSGTAVSGSTSGYTYNVDATHGNGSAFDLSVGAATHPVWGDSDARSVLVMLLYETGGAVTASGSASLGSMGATGSGLVANAVTSSGSASLASMGATGSGVTGSAPPGYPVGHLGAKVELFLGTDWVDVTAAALPNGAQDATITSGQPDGAQQPTPSSMPLVLDNPGGDFSPRNSAGPYFGELRQNTPARVSVNSVYGAYLRLENDNDDMASVADTSALHVTGSMEIRLGVILSDWRPCTLAARNDGTTTSWALALNSDGTLHLDWRDSGGTLRTVTSPAAAGVSWKAIRVTLDASNGNVQFYLSDSIEGTWTSMGAAASGTSGAATSVRAGNSPLIIGWSAAGGTQMRGQVYGFRMYAGITDGSVILDTAGDPILDTAGDPILDTSAPPLIADAAFSEQVPGVTAWTDTTGLTWVLSGGAELTGRDYRLHGELSSPAPTADVSSSKAQAQTTVFGRLRRLQAGSAPSALSAMKRAILAQSGSLAPVDYWTLEDGPVAKQFGAAVGTQLMTASSGTVQAAADSSFEASAPLPQLNGDSLSATVDTYGGATAWTVRFLGKVGQLPPTGVTERLASVSLASGTVRRVDVLIDDAGDMGISGFNSSGGSVFATSLFSGYDIANPKWFSIEGTTSGGSTIFNVITLAPGASSGEQLGGTLPSTSGAPANVSSVTFNPDLFFTDTVIGHVTVQKAWTTLFALGAPLNAWRGEFTADRFSRVCAENGITCRILGRPFVTQAMGPQPRGSAWKILLDCAQTEQGLIFEPRDCFGLAFRTRESLGAQSAAVTFDFSAPNLRGDVQPADDDTGFLNDVTGQMPDGTTWREVLNDGSAKSVSEPKEGGAGTYAGSVPFSLNVADAGELPSAVAFYLGRVSVDAPRYRNVTGDFGIPGAPVADIARLRPGDLVAAVSVPAVYQSGDISQLAQSATELLSTGRKITWDCVPSSPFAL